MTYDFLKNFPQRMKNVGLYATLAGNITSRTKWNEYGFEKNNERINLVFSVLLFIMEVVSIVQQKIIGAVAEFKFIRMNASHTIDKGTEQFHPAFVCLLGVL